MLHRLRRAVVRPDSELRRGEVEVDETYLALTDPTRSTIKFFLVNTELLVSGRHWQPFVVRLARICLKWPHFALMS